MEEKKIIQILNKCKDVSKVSSVAIKWVNNFIKNHPHIVEVPEELNKILTDTQLDLFDLDILLENTLKKLGNEEENK